MCKVHNFRQKSDKKFIMPFRAEARPERGKTTPDTGACRYSGVSPLYGAEGIVTSLIRSVSLLQ